MLAFCIKKPKTWDHQSDDRWTERRTNGETEKQTDKRTDNRTDKQKDKWMDKLTCCQTKDQPTNHMTYIVNCLCRVTYYFGPWNWPYLNAIYLGYLLIDLFGAVWKLQEISFPELMCESALSGTVWPWERFPRKRSLPKFRKNDTFESFEYVASASTQCN